MFANDLGDKYADYALDAYLKAVDYEPDNGYAHYNVALCYAGKKSWENARLHLDKAEINGIIISPQIKSMFK